MTDEELVRRCCEGDQVALEQFVRRWSPRVYAVCRARLDQTHHAEDATQETMMRGIAQLPRLENGDKTGAWLRRIAVHVCADWIRIQSRQRTALLNSKAIRFVDRTEVALHDRDNHQPESDEQLHAAIQSLARELREPLMLFYFDDMTYEQIAQVLEISRATVNARLAKARRQLAKQLTSLSN